MIRYLFLTLCLGVGSIHGEDMKAAPYGSWKSPITADKAAATSVRFLEIHIQGNQIFWLERHPSEGGRVVLMSWNSAGGVKEVLPKEYSVRTRANEYGGGALLIAGDRIYFSNDKDQQLYCLEAGKVRQVTHEKNARFADGCIDAKEGSLYYVREVHGDKVVNTIVKIQPKSGEIKTVASGHDFYSNPRISPDGRQLAYLRWDQPNMSWDGSELYLLDLKTSKERLIAGGKTESIADPQWGPDGALYYVSDRSNWWNIYKEGETKSLYPLEAEFTLPQWVFRTSLYAFSKEGIVASYMKNGVSGCALKTKEGWRSLDLPYMNVDGLVASGDMIALIAGSPEQPLSIVVYDLKKQQNLFVKHSSPPLEDSSWISIPQAIEFPTTGGKTAHAFYYPPTNPHFKGMPDEKPPVLVLSHGGPTAGESPCYSTHTLFWTSRGFAVVDVNYGGSTGYGRAYRERLNGQWGIVDVDDCTNAPLYLAEKGLVDRNRFAIEGGSAGGFTTLAVLAFRDVFKVGADYFGVSDLEGLAVHTHKFEERYLDILVGPYPEDKAIYRERSPLYSVDKIKCPVIILQGDEDAIVPPAQSEMMYNSLKERGIPTAYLLFKGEQHGFRKAENIQRALEAQLYFFSKILHFPLGEKIPPVEIDNLKNWKG